MSGKVRIQVRETRGEKGRRRLAATEAAPPTSAADDPQPPERIPRVARVLALAHHWQGLVRSGAVKDQAELARLVGVSRARVTQVMRLLDLAPNIQEAVLGGEIAGPGAELVLRAVAEEPVWSRQMRGLAMGPREASALGRRTDSDVEIKGTSEARL